MSDINPIHYLGFEEYVETITESPSRLDIWLAAKEDAEQQLKDCTVVRNSDLGTYYLCEEDGHYTDEPNLLFDDLEIGAVQKVERLLYFKTSPCFAAKVYDVKTGEAMGCQLFENEEDANNAAKHSFEYFHAE